jgi:hypothetical protein
MEERAHVSLADVAARLTEGGRLTRLVCGDVAIRTSMTESRSA